MKNTLCERILASNNKIVLVVAGGGSEVIGELLRYGNGSRILLDAQVPYCQIAFEEFLDGTPDKFVSEDAACSLALAAFKRARKLYTGPDPLIGLAATASLAKENEREGRLHHLHIAFQTSSELHATFYPFPNNLPRESEETLTAQAILDQLAHACALSPCNCTTVYKPVADVPKVLFGDRRLVNLTNFVVNLPAEKVLFPGSFNPFHSGHINMAETAARLTQTVVGFEISCVNVDKAPLHFKAVEQRRGDFLRTRAGRAFMGDLYLTQAPFFSQKAALFPGVTFVVGFDTFSRINDRTYYDSKIHFEETLKIFHDNAIKWIVFPRLKADGTVSSPEDVTRLPLHNKDVRIVSETEHPLVFASLSSTAIRKGG